MKKRILATGLFLSLLITCTLSACASGAAPSAASADTSETASAAAAGASETTPAASSAVIAASAAVSESAPDSGSPVLWPSKDMPVSLKYDRMWIYSAHAETDDPDTISGIVEAQGKSWNEVKIIHEPHRTA